MKNVACGGQKREGRNSKNLSDDTLNQDKAGEKDNESSKTTDKRRHRRQEKKGDDRQAGHKLLTARANSCRRVQQSWGFGAAEVCRPTAVKTLKQKDHLLEEERRGGRMEG